MLHLQSLTIINSKTALVSIFECSLFIFIYFFVNLLATSVCIGMCSGSVFTGRSCPMLVGDVLAGLASSFLKAITVLFRLAHACAFFWFAKKECQILGPNKSNFQIRRCLHRCFGVDVCSIRMWRV